MSVNKVPTQTYRTPAPNTWRESWYNKSPNWLIEAYHNDVIVYRIMDYAEERNWGYEETLLEIIQELLSRDKQNNQRWHPLSDEPVSFQPVKP